MSKKLAVSLVMFSSISSLAHAQVLPQLRENLDNGKDVKLLVVGDSIVGGYGVIGILPDKGGCRIDENYHQDTWAFQLGKQIDLAYNRPTRTGHVNVRIVNRKEQTNAVANGATRTPDAIEPNALMVSQYYPWSPTLTIVRDGVGGSNILRLLGRIQSTGRTPSGERVNEGAASRSDGVIIAVGINDSLAGVMPTAPACPTFSPWDYLDGVGWRNLATWGTSSSDFRLGLDSVVKNTTLQHSAPGFSTEIAVATPITLPAISTAPIDSEIKAYVAGYGLGNVKWLDLSQRYDLLPDNVHPSPRGHIDMARKVFEEMFLSGSSLTRLKNSSFESPSLDSMAMDFKYGLGDHWIISPLEPGKGGAGITKNSIGAFSGATVPPAPELRTGKQIALLQGDGKIAQDVNLMAGNRYHVRFLATQRIIAGYRDQDVGVFLDGVQLGRTFTPVRGAYTAWDFDLSVSVSGTHRIEIRGMKPWADVTAFIDDVQIGLRAVDVAKNLSFEFPRLSTLGVDFAYDKGDDWTVFSPGPGKGGAGITKNATGGFTGTTVPPDPALQTGSQVAVLQGSGWVEQEMYLEPGFHIRFRATQRELIGPISQSVGVLVNGVLQGSTTPARGWYSDHDIALSIPAAGKYRVRLSGMKEGDISSFVDDVRVGW